MRDDEQLAREFDEHRVVLLGAAYRVVGSGSDAEDVVQETWLRWSKVDHEEVRDVRAYLIRIATRLALNKLREQKTRREQYVGPWLPEPIVKCSEPHGDPEAVVELADSVSMAMLVVLETLSPLERATFVLREVFDLPYAEIADTLGRSEAAVRQLAHRARSHVQARQPRHQVDKARHTELTQQFMAAADSGDFERVVALLAPDAVLISDGGGKKSAALRPIYGAEKIIRWLFGVIAQYPGYELRIATLNGEPAFVVYYDNEPDTVTFLETSGDLITSLYLIRNPDKLTMVPMLEELG
ncbi:RNA polymerase sigma factor SigJ [Kribbella sandramycini]|uniref:RNA polymerase sigma factor SigJ n=1 Tax=Kribbella sandramycini TaxID=60450 RepID=A0A7Y4L5L4_9ACTN|nr:RNA polymerase sigma factor SigJ [Kribbella sandramycini]MBB6570969.1 RNA polymerase sigma-70 factor (ECF subfamily) [Kribbella sandramycini]NOL43621.1 RNA polymerase sigma factor SigJ [Kribbella sandramycini]